MLVPILLLGLVALPLGILSTLLARALGHRLQALDGAGVTGQIKMAARKVPNTGGIGVVTTWLTCVGGGLAVLVSPWAPLVVKYVPALEQHLARVREQAWPGLWLVLCVLALHVMGVIDDRRPLRPWPKLLVMLGVSCAAVLLIDPAQGRVLTVLDAHVGGAWLSILLTVLWIGAVTNALNFIDNMDGLCAGVTVICAGALLAIALAGAQWLIAGVLAVLIGACAGFLVFNYPLRKPATIFLGDGGSLVCGFLLAYLSVRLTYAGPGLREAGAGAGDPHWHAVLVPLVVLAVPLYDMLSVTLIRLRQGKSPLVGDLQHLSHRLHFRGLTRRDTVIVIHGLTAITALGATLLPRVETVAALVIFAQTVLALVVLAIYEWRASQAARENNGAGRARDQA
jgi:UDP-GlcNAc:undecaprenyl-phosphate GlcNAc-1-phosphate transferase